MRHFLLNGLPRVSGACLELEKAYGPLLVGWDARLETGYPLRVAGYNPFYGYWFKEIETNHRFRVPRVRSQDELWITSPPPTLRRARSLIVQIGWLRGKL